MINNLLAGFFENIAVIFSDFKYLSDNYAWLFNQENTCKWNGYSNNDEMYLYKKLDISELSIKDLVEKVMLDLELIYFYVKALEETNG